ncbi:hypothetical protein [Pantoea sp. 1.19]|uniref:hypothetical protein n=1 Tax=Pantoea sp. 1.19 TaxID=1925589 RepID=UPI000948CDBC|nr:hypothetical protein [Pantoea sp. 1.19]
MWTACPGATHPPRTARVLATLSRAITTGEPDLWRMHSERCRRWNGISRQNRNGLRWGTDLRVDGLTSGDTAAGGRNPTASGAQERRRLITLVIGA